MKKVVTKQNDELSIILLFDEEITNEELVEAKSILHSMIKSNISRDRIKEIACELAFCIDKNLHSIQIISNKKNTFGQIYFSYKNKKAPYVRAFGRSFAYSKFKEIHSTLLKECKRKL